MASSVTREIISIIAGRAIIKKNDIRETRQPMKRIGIRVSAKAKNVELAANKIEGFAHAVKDLRG